MAAWSAVVCASVFRWTAEDCDAVRSDASVMCSDNQSVSQASSLLQRTYEISEIFFNIAMGWFYFWTTPTQLAFAGIYIDNILQDTENVFKTLRRLLIC